MNPDDLNIDAGICRPAAGGRSARPIRLYRWPVAGLLMTDPAMPAIRPTEDVDLLVLALTLVEYHHVGKVLTARGFSHDMRPEPPICRWRVGGVAVDVMPTADEILGFSNR